MLGTLLKSPHSVLSQL